MKIYTDEHLESVPKWYIQACGNTVRMLRGEIDYKDGGDTCPAINSGSEYGCCGQDHLCPRFIVYDNRGPICPCCKFGKEMCIELLTNLITQWKKWAGVED